jgi:hypothetical protein
MEDKTKDPEIIVLKFADSKVPEFKETRNKDYILYGEDNRYPEYLTYLFNKSAKHNAIITGKASYVFGEGFENGDAPVNRLGETLNDIIRKAILDVEIYGGFRLEIIWGVGRKIAEIYHVDYTTLRKAKDGSGFFFREEWKKWDNKEDTEFINGFNPAEPIGSQIYSYDEYRPMLRHYPLPSYIGCNNYVETDIEISKFYLSAIRNGMNPSKMIQFYKGEPSDEKKKEIERRFANKFSGSENAGRFIMVFNDKQEQTVKIDDLSGSELDKMFVELNKITQQEIYAGHGITSPMLFGIKTEGQLGGSTELKMAYEIFVNTYVKPKAKAVDREVNYIMSFAKAPGKYELRQTDPIGLQLDPKDFIDILPQDFVFEKLGIPQEYAAPTSPTATAPGGMVNENIKNLSGKQHQQMLRIIRQYGQGKITEAIARTMLRTGLGLSEEDISSILGIPAKMSAQDDDGIDVFDEFGDDREDYEILKTKRVCFTLDEIEEDERVYKDAFLTVTDLSRSEATILSLIKKDPRITADVLAKAINQTKAYVESKIGILTKRGLIESTTETIGSDTITVRSIVEPKMPAIPDNGKPAQIFIKYAYEGPQDSRNRPFCAKLMQLKRMYSRREIELISERLGYSVFDRRGGFWNKDGTILPHCRHKWVSHIVVKKGGQQS